MPAIPPFTGATTSESTSAEISEGVLTHVSITSSNELTQVLGTQFVAAFLMRGGTDMSNRIATLCYGVISALVNPTWNGFLETRDGDLILVRGRGSSLNELRIQFSQLTAKGRTPLTNYVRHLATND